MTRRLIITLSFIVAALFLVIPYAPLYAKEGTVKVGVYDNAPIVFQDEEGNFRGFSLEVLEYIASKENWDLEYIFGTWPECLARLEKGQTDIQVYIAYSKERARKYDFTQEALLDNWGIIYTWPGSGIETVLDLEGKTVALLSEGIHAIAFKKLIKNFGIQLNIIEVDNRSSGFRLVEEKKADAVVVNRIFGLANAKNYNIEKTNIIFNPIEIRYAMPKDKNRDLGIAIDKHLKLLKADKVSIFYKSFNKSFDLEEAFVPGWIKWTLATGAGVCCLLFGINIFLKSEVKKRTRALESEILERKQVEEALREERDKAQKYLDIAGVMFVVINADQQVVQINKKGCEILGYGEKEIIGRNWFDTFLRRKDQRKTKKVYKQLMAGEAELAEYYENSVVTKGGEERLIAWHNTILTDDMGRAMGTLSSGEDITGRRQVEEAQRDSEEKYRILVEEAPVSIMAFDGEGRVTFVNNWHLKTFAKSKYGPDFFVGKKITELPGVVRAGIAPELERVLKGETVFLEDAYFPEFTGGHSGYQSIRGVPVFKGDEFVGGILLREDVTQRRRAEEELNKHREHLEELVRDRTKDVEDAQKALVNLLEDVNLSKQDLESANEKLKELDHLKSMFIASMSHELRTPLNSIIGFTGIILQGMTGEINPEQRDQLQRVYGSAKHLLALINDVIDISKIEAGKFEVNVEEFELNEVIREAVSNLTPEITNKGLDLEINLPQDTQLMTDRKRLLQCVLNYLSNAVKFTEKGGIRIAVHEDEGMRDVRTRDEGRKDEGRKDEGRGTKGEEATGRPSSIVISVADTGIGIKEEDVPKLFGSFVRLDSPIRTTTLGTGLGLYLTRKIATEMLGGEVFVESTYGEGSTFGMRIPKEI